MERLRLALAMGYSDWDSFLKNLNRQMLVVHSHFEQVFALPQTDSTGHGDQQRWGALWAQLWSDEEARVLLAQHAFAAPDEAWRLLKQLRTGAAYRTFSPQGRERLDQLIPMVMGAVSATSNADVTLQRLLRIIEAIGRRSAYFSLLIEHPMALSQLVKLCSASHWVAEFIAQHPLVMDELLDPRALYAPLDKHALEQELQDNLSGIASDDLEQQMELMRQFKHSNVMRVAAADVANVLPLMVVSDHLTEIAEVVLAEVLKQSWQSLARKHGVPRLQGHHTGDSPGFAIIAYGKMGGIELGYGSDLDLVFLYDAAQEEGQTHGAQPIEQQLFFARLGQRIIHMLGTRTASGVLYEVDMRLRPSGAAGLLVTSIAGFGDYQHHSAWTWEHQALVRARPVAGDPTIAAQFNQIRAEILG
ncbi:MAG: glutamate-ammonia-ligase adenylyltransferase, partial [Halothiobacillaceae bacterium]